MSNIELPVLPEGVQQSQCDGRLWKAGEGEQEQGPEGGRTGEGDLSVIEPDDRGHGVKGCDVN